MGKMTHGPTDPKFLKKFSVIQPPSAIQTKKIKNLTHAAVGTQQDQHRHSNFRHTLRHAALKFLTHHLAGLYDRTSLSECQYSTGFERFCNILNVSILLCFYHNFPVVCLTLLHRDCKYVFQKLAAQTLLSHCFTFKNVQP